MDCIARRHTQTSDADRQVNSTLAKFGNSGIYVAAEGLKGSIAKLLHGQGTWQ